MERLNLWRQHRTLLGNATRADDKSKEDTNVTLLSIMARMECFQWLMWPWNTIALKTDQKVPGHVTAKLYIVCLCVAHLETESNVK